MDRLDAIKIFVRVVESGSFSAVARELGVGQPAVSKQVASVTGDYDKTGLPDPLELRFYFTLAGDAIAQLIVIPAKRP
jgi:hypothetical protein